MTWQVVIVTVTVTGGGGGVSTSDTTTDVTTDVTGARQGEVVEERLAEHEGREPEDIAPAEPPMMASL